MPRASLSRPVRVLIIEKSSGLSGSTMSLCLLAANLPSRIVLPTIAFSLPEQLRFFRDHYPGHAEALVVRCSASMKTRGFALKLLERARAVHPRLERGVRRLLAMADLLLVHAPYTVRLAIAMRGRGIDVVQQNNGLDLAATVLCQLARKPYLAYQRGQEYDSRTTRYLATKVDAWIANSQTTLADLRRIGVPEEMISVVTPPVDLAKYDPDRVDDQRPRDELRIGEGTPAFAILGSLLEWKGQTVFLQAAALVLARVPSAKAFVIGEVPDGGDPNYRQGLIDLAWRLGIAERVTFTGFRQDMAEIIKTQKVIVHASLTPEPFGRVVVEAMAMKRGVVASAEGGPSEIIQDGEDGFLVPAGDHRAMADRICELLMDPELIKRIGEKARLKVQRQFGLDSHIERMCQIYTALVESRQGSSGRGKVVPTTK